MNRFEKKLLRLIKEESLKRGDFTLASGAKSDYFIDLKTIMVSSRGANLIGKVLYRKTRDLPCHSIGGMQAGAIPLVTATVIQYHRHRKSKDGFWVRPEVKDHGTQQKTEGYVIKEGDDVIVLEDVSTTGASAMKVVTAVREMGGVVARVVSLVDRRQGARELFASEGIAFCSVFTVYQVLEENEKDAARNDLQ